MKTFGVVVALLALAALPQDKPQDKSQDKSQDKPKKRELKDRVKVEGKIVCVGCTLAEEYGANAQCTLHAKHAQALLDTEGKLWTIVDNARGHLVITNKKLRNQTVRVFGWPYKKHQHIEASTWTTSRRSTTRWVIARATSCFRKPPSASPPACARRIR